MGGGGAYMHMYTKSEVSLFKPVARRGCTDDTNDDDANGQSMIA